MFCCVNKTIIKFSVIHIFLGSLIENCNRDAYITACETAKNLLTDTSSIDLEMKELYNEMEVVAGLTRKCIEDNSTTAQDQNRVADLYNSYVERYEKAREKHDSLAAQKEEKKAKERSIDRFIKALKSRENLLTEFDDRLWLYTLEYATVNKDGTILFRFFDGSEAIG